MVRIMDIAESLDFYCNKLGMSEVRRIENETGRFTLIFLAAPGDEKSALADNRPTLELTYNWSATVSESDGPETVADKPTEEVERYSVGRNFGHLAYQVEDIYKTCRNLMNAGVVINRPPRDGRMAFIKSPDDVSIELLQNGDALPPQEPWATMDNTGTW